MLVLSRRKNESIIMVTPVGVTIRVCVTKIDYEQVKIGIEAPVDFKIFRQEIYDTMPDRLKRFDEIQP